VSTNTGLGSAPGDGLVEDTAAPRHPHYANDEDAARPRRALSQGKLCYRSLNQWQFEAWK